ncbi:MAG: O-antigen ligase family protein [Pseudomonadota bacterium]
MISTVLRNADDLTALLSSAGVIVFLSTLWVESDAYRYVGLLLVLSALAIYLRNMLGDPARPRIGYAGIICLAWTILVAFKVLLAAGETGSFDVGSAEGIYLFAALYPTLGHSFEMLRVDWQLVSKSFIIFTSVALAASFDTAYFDAQNAIPPLFFNNPIHASFACAVLLIAHIQLFVTAPRAAPAFFGRAWVGKTLIAVNIALAGFYILMLNSKGVWLALAITVCATLPISLIGRKITPVFVASGFALVVVATSALLFSPRVERVAGETVASVQSFVEQGVSGESVTDAMLETVDNPQTPESLRIRMEIMYDAVRIWQRAPILGHGPSWETLWEDRRFQEHDFNLLHNGYLEIMVRHGLFGIGFYTFILGWSLTQMIKAARHGLTSHTVWKTAALLLVFFASAQMTNSYTRLAAGESFMWLFSAVGFYFAYKMQQAGIIRPRTFI